MAGGKLTDKAIKNAKAGRQLTILSDGGGLQLWLMPASAPTATTSPMNSERWRGLFAAHRR